MGSNGIRFLCFCIYLYLHLYSCTSEMRVGSQVSHFSLGRLSVFTPSSFSSWTWCKRRDFKQKLICLILDQYLRARDINFIFIKTNDHQPSGLTQASTTSSKYVWSDSDVNFKTGASVWWMENPFSGTCPASRSTFRLTGHRADCSPVQYPSPRESRGFVTT